MLINFFKNVLKTVLPERIRGLLTGLFYGWHGNYQTWNAASTKCTGYNTPGILEKIAESTAIVRDSQTGYERDSVIYNKIQYSYPVLAGLMLVASKHNNNLNVLDFGGALGSSYFQNKRFLDLLNNVNWGIVEQSDFVELGKNDFTTERLQFFYSVDECLSSYKPHAVLLSGVLQYLEDPFKFIDELVSKDIEFIIIDRTCFVKGNERITIQKVHPAIYKATYPCWFFNKDRFINYLSGSYELLLEFDALDKANFPSEFKGFIFKRSNV